MGNVYMEADQVRFKNSTYHNLQTAVAAALEGGGGGGTTVVANPEGSATADLSKLQVGTTIYGIPADAGEVYSTTPVKVGSWLGSDLYRVVISAGAMPSGASGDTVKEVNASIITGRCVMAYLFGQAQNDNNLMFLPYTSISQITNCITWRYVDNVSEDKKFIISLGSGNDQSGNDLYIIAYYIAS